MLESAFSFRGRLGRLPFFLGSLGVAVATVVGLVAGLAGVGLAAKRHEWVVVALLVVALLPFAVAALWCSVSLHVRRIRDIGWDPTIIIGIWVFARLADSLVLAHFLPPLATHGIWRGTAFGVALNIVLSLLLRLWPSHDQADHDARDLRPGPPRWADNGRLAPAAPPIPAARLARATGPRREFGRR